MNDGLIEMSRFFLSAFLLLAPAGPLCAQESGRRAEAAEPPKNCYGDAAAKWVVGDTFVGLTNPVGFENQLRISRCWPLIEKGGILFAYTNLESGFFHYISVPYTHQGLFASLTPLSFVNFRLEAAGVYLWPVPALAGVGYFGRRGYRDDFPSDGMAHDIDVNLGDAGGVNITLTTTLQGAVTLKQMSRGKLELLAVDALGVEYWSMGDDPYYYNQRKDVILARSDWIVTNFAVLMLGIPVKRGASLRLGVLDSLLYVPSGGVVGSNQVGAMISFYFEKTGKRVRGLQPFLQAAYYTNHSSRALTFALDFLVGVDLAVVLL
jgi:hypothetical protein